VAASPDDLLNPCDLETARRWADRAFADLPDPIKSIGGELVPGETDHRHGGSMRNTVADASYITADASKSDLAFDERLALANASPRCGARRRDGQPCRAPAMPNGRCRMHGGPSTGPRTPEGLERSRRSNWKHGYYSAKEKRVRRDARQQYRLLRQLIAAGNEDDVLDLIRSI
jgi:hypothetical protein